MGFAFAFGVAAVAWRGRTRRGGVPFVHVAAVLAAVVLPIGMALAGGFAGLLQRLMFAIAYAWYTIEPLDVSHPDAGRRTLATGPSTSGRRPALRDLSVKPDVAAEGRPPGPALGCVAGR
jgi:hypothetical protein